MSLIEYLKKHTTRCLLFKYLLADLVELIAMPLRIFILATTLLITIKVSAFEPKVNSAPSFENKVYQAPSDIKTTEHIATETKLNKRSLSTADFNRFHQCKKNFEYAVYFLKQKVGFLHRTVSWKNSRDIKHNGMISATITSNSNVKFLFLQSTYQQTSYMHYLPEQGHFLTSRFSQKITGLRSREMDTNISANGLSSTVTLDDEVYHYQNEELPIYDIDTLAAQMRLNLLEKKQKFTLARQGSEEVKYYHFEVVGPDILNHKEWGELSTIKVIEVGEHKGTELWFSIKGDYQLVKSKLDLIFSPTVWLTHFEKSCNRKPSEP